MNRLAIIFVLSICCAACASPLSPIQYQSAHVLKQSTIQMQSALASVQTVTNWIALFTDPAMNASGAILETVDNSQNVTNHFTAGYNGTNWTMFAVNLPRDAVTNDQWSFRASVTNGAGDSAWSQTYYFPPLLTNSIFNLGFANEYPVPRWSTNRLAGMSIFWRLDTNGVMQFTVTLPPKWTAWTPTIKATSTAYVPKTWMVYQYAQ